MTVREFLESYEYNGYSNPMNLEFDNKDYLYDNGTHISEALPIKIDGEHLPWNAMKKTLTDFDDDSILDRTVKNWSVQADIKPDGSIFLCPSIFTERV